MKEFFKKNFIVSIYGAWFLVGYGLFKYSIFTNDESLFLFTRNFIKFSDIVIGIIIFIVWFKDERFKLLYYLGFLFIGKYIGFITGEICSYLSGIIESIFLIMFSGTVLIQLCYNFFKGLSYKKYSKL